MVRETWVQSQVASYQRLKKIVLDTSLLNTQQYKVRIKGKVGQSWERRSAPPLHLGVVAIEKGSPVVALHYGRQLNFTYCSDSATLYITRIQKRDGKKAASSFSPRKVTLELPRTTEVYITHTSIEVKKICYYTTSNQKIRKFLRRINNIRPAAGEASQTWQPTWQSTYSCLRLQAAGQTNQRERAHSLSSLPSSRKDQATWESTFTLHWLSLTYFEQSAKHLEESTSNLGTIGVWEIIFSSFHPSF